jgi:hypothetical protein
MWTIGNKSNIRRVRNFLIGLAILILVPTIINFIFGDLKLFQSLKHFIREISFGFTIGACFWLGNWTIGHTTGKKLNWRKNPAKANLISMLLFISWGLLVSLTLPYIYAKYVWEIPAERLISSVVANAFVCISVDIIIISFFYSNYLVYYWGESIKNEEELKRENLIARYEALKNQVNPHFLFNTLNTLTGVVEQNPEKATEFIRKFSDIYRYVLDQKDKELIPLKEELDFVEDYIYLSKIRYGNGLIVEKEIVNMDLFIVPLGLQMLIENAIKHNIISDDQPLVVEIGGNDEYIYVKNTLQRKSSIEITNQVGLDNLVKRYEYLSDRKVEIVETETHFEVCLPLLKNRQQ